MKAPPLAAALLGMAALSGCVAPTGPVSVTRFVAPEAGTLGRGVVAIEPAGGIDPASLEYRTYAGAVARQLALVGYGEQVAGASSPYTAQIRFERRVYSPERRRGPVSVGLGGSTGSYGGGVGLGIGIDLSGRPPEQVETELAVTIRDRQSGRPLWEGRANFIARGDSPLAQTQLGAAKMAEALFKDFPGNSGETVEVR